jgi:uncharacterized protein YktB (UPF0637 family)
MTAKNQHQVGSFDEDLYLSFSAFHALPKHQYYANLEKAAELAIRKHGVGESASQAVLATSPKREI